MSDTLTFRRFDGAEKDAARALAADALAEVVTALSRELQVQPHSVLVLCHRLICEDLAATDLSAAAMLMIATVEDLTESSEDSQMAVLSAMIALAAADAAQQERPQ